MRPGGVEQRGVHPVDEHGDEPVDARHGRQQFVAGMGGVDVPVGDLVTRRFEAAHDVTRHPCGDVDAAHGQTILRTSGNGRWRIALPSGSQGQAGTRALAFSFSIASTMARTPGSVSAMKGVCLTRSFISERM